ncbi:hypothetical protein A6D6_02253 [Alcanivorax xiamenensis]|uniref:Gluconate 2-dehydrogenase subunit 3 family protein n=1 Tax=Alcanivorax xiamenensis TaxID=1177156 RepID=A0ABQ6Y7I3_9GAMM|nr:hypothetical protein [Alcanivorax xiamenensis]KAF0805447.1 hypothetical protein A6D6_02253 [Alcanivorax xiamenensis]
MTQQHSAPPGLEWLQQGLARRRFLKWTLAASAVMVGTAAGGFLWLRRSPLDQQRIPDWAGGLSPGEFLLLDRCRRVLLPTEGRGLPDTETVPVVANVQRTLSLMAPALRRQLSRGLGLFDNAAVFRHGRRFVDLDDETARDYFDRWGRGLVLQRTLATVIKQLVYSAYWRDERTWQALEFDGPVSDRWGLAYLGNAPMPEENGEVQVGVAE